MDLKALQARVARLETLWIGFSKEESLWKNSLYPLNTQELRDYLAALHQAQKGIDQARITLARACQRLEELQR